MNAEDWKNLHPGDIVRNIASRNEYVVILQPDEQGTVVLQGRALRAFRPDSWDIVGVNMLVGLDGNLSGEHE